MSDTDTGGTPRGGTSGGDTPVDPRLLEILVCPISKRQLTYDREAGELISETARLAFPIRDGVPIMLVDEARSLDDEPGRAPAGPR
ncbi:MAG: Trm112 family protein [Thalassobaculum sp.]|uniref:Trm112 family protein n=1 Tax=Thalassobaculum sp. TaxID=2022740 RepID=UPI0032EC8872